MDVKTAIETGDAQTLRGLLRENPSLADALIRWGERDCILTHPLHYVSDVLFSGALQRGNELPLLDVLIEAGADLDYQEERGNGKKGDTPLIGAASLGAEDAGLKLLQAGARPELRGLFGETALHWASLLGEDRLAKELIKVSDVNLSDDRYHSPAIGMGDPWLLCTVCRESRKTARSGGAAGGCRCKNRDAMVGIGTGAV